MNSERRRAVYRNIFPAAHAFADRIPDEKWHVDRKGVCDTDVRHSSQALALDVFGTIDGLPERGQILDSIAGRGERQPSAVWTMTPEYEVDHSLLGEPRPTQIDILARCDRSVIAFECKFTERGGGECSQPRPLRRRGKPPGPPQCNGSYEWQTPEGDGQARRCALTAKGVRYWDLIPKVFDSYRADADYRPCPFAGSAYQWMRNLAASVALGEREGLHPTFVVVYADGVEGEPLPMAAKISTPAWKEFAASVRPDVALRWMSYLELIAIAEGAVGPSSATLLTELREWVLKKYRHAKDRVN